MTYCELCGKPAPMHDDGCLNAVPKPDPAEKSPKVMGVITACEDLSMEEIGQVLAELMKLALVKALGS